MGFGKCNYPIEYKADKYSIFDIYEVGMKPQKRKDIENAVKRERGSIKKRGEACKHRAKGTAGCVSLNIV